MVWGLPSVWASFQSSPATPWIFFSGSGRVPLLDTLVFPVPVDSTVRWAGLSVEDVGGQDLSRRLPKALSQGVLVYHENG